MAAEQITVSRDHVYAMKGNAASVSLTVTPPDTTQDQVTLYRRKLGPNGNNGQWTNLIAVLAHPNRQSVNDLLNAGDVIEYGMFRTSANPAEGATPIVSRKVCCLRSPPEGHVTVVDNRITPGGTFAELFANTGSRTTFLRAYVRPGPATTPQAVSLPSSE
ncbi:MAG TPA: hypothetical protein VJ809_17575, partial [Pirellulales bacterium]|nr:hypothetical protein [Pirellulales bacterium]